MTGARSGLGKAIATKIATFPWIDTVLAVSRRITAADVTALSPKIRPVAADVATVEGRAKIRDAVDQLCCGSSNTTTTTNDDDNGATSTKSAHRRQRQLRYLVHNAGIIDPLKSILDVTPNELRRALQKSIARDPCFSV